MNAYAPMGSWAIDSGIGLGSTNPWQIAEPVINFRRDPERYLLRSAVLALPSVSRARGYAEISQATLAVALNIIAFLPENRMLPKVGVDRDGDILMVWGEQQISLALTVEGETLHMVVNPGPASNHLDSLIYNGGYLPAELLRNIPTR